MLIIQQKSCQLTKRDLENSWSSAMVEEKGRLENLSYNNLFCQPLVHYLTNSQILFVFYLQFHVGDAYSVKKLIRWKSLIRSNVESKGSLKVVFHQIDLQYQISLKSPDTVNHIHIWQRANTKCCINFVCHMQIWMYFKAISNSESFHAKKEVTRELAHYE